MFGSPNASTVSGNNAPISGMITHHTSSEPAQMMVLYFSPTI